MNISDYADQTKINYALNQLAKEYGQEASQVVEELINNRLDYLTWNADFEVSFSKDVKAGSVALAGYYGAFAENYYDNNWLGFGISNIDAEKNASDVKAGEAIRLLETMDKVFPNPDFHMNYAAICGYVKEFSCGIANLSDENIGTVVTVNLYIYETDANGNETGEKMLCGTYTYTLEAVQPFNK